MGYRNKSIREVVEKPWIIGGRLDTSPPDVAKRRISRVSSRVEDR
jgi:hypothetical protein